MTISLGILAASGGSGPPTGAFTASASDIVSGVTHTFAAVPIGAAASDRIVQVYVSCRQGTTITNVTIGGVIATLGAAQSSASSVIARMAHALVPTGVTDTIVVTTSGTSTNCGISVFRLTGVTAPVEQVNTGGGGAISLTAALDATKIAIAGYSSDANGSSPAVTWTNATETSDYQVQNGVVPLQSTGIVIASGAVIATGAGHTGCSLNLQTWGP